MQMAARTKAIGTKTKGMTSMVITYGKKRKAFQNTRGSSRMILDMVMVLISGLSSLVTTILESGKMESVMVKVTKNIQMAHILMGITSKTNARAKVFSQRKTEKKNMATGLIMRR